MRIPDNGPLCIDVLVTNFIDVVADDDSDSTGLFQWPAFDVAKKFEANRLAPSAGKI